ncbi:hypothetical protein V491_08082 [Pseudogymnoascus sp. VKM F-3775]|nr:hypothetical protein V491_08082 [Pseudogymnoascus sp. VKM F-3775]
MSSSSYYTRRSIPSDAHWILETTARVQAALTASGSLQELANSSLDKVHTSIQNEYVFIFQDVVNNKLLGAVTISLFCPEAGYGSSDWGIRSSGKKWYLHSLLLEPAYQGQGLGVLFLKEALSLFRAGEGVGVVVLDCWAGNGKLRSFYERVGFVLHGEFPEEDYYITVFALKLDRETMQNG